jgi:hypothetical protein
LDRIEEASLVNRRNLWKCIRSSFIISTFPR